MNNDITTYYAKRADEYERIYQKPERQDDICKLKDMLSFEEVSHNREYPEEIKDLIVHMELKLI